MYESNTTTAIRMSNCVKTCYNMNGEVLRIDMGVNLFQNHELPWFNNFIVCSVTEQAKVTNICLSLFDLLWYLS